MAFSKLKQQARQALRSIGFDLVRYSEADVGVDAMLDIRRFVGTIPEPVIFDVGANVGQSISLFRRALPDSRIYSFEPSPRTFGQLERQWGKVEGIHLANCGVGAAEGRMRLEENEVPEMSSFLPPSATCGSPVIGATDVEVVTVDGFAAHRGVKFVHVLKSDTQGFEFQVLAGADRMLSSGNIALVHLEVILSNMYEGLPSAWDLFRFLTERNYLLAAFYKPAPVHGVVSWFDVLFVHREFHEDWKSQRKLG